jgi:hypothetical protein
MRKNSSQQREHVRARAPPSLPLPLSLLSVPLCFPFFFSRICFDQRFKTLKKAHNESQTKITKERKPSTQEITKEN